MGISIQPVNFIEGNPVDPILCEAVQKFAEAEFGHRLNLKLMGKVWAAVKISEEGEGYEVVGVTGISQALDCHTFHIKGGGESDEGREEARGIRDRLMQRAANYVQDYTGVGTDVLVFVSDAQQKFWKGYLRLIGAKPANRFIVKV